MGGILCIRCTPSKQLNIYHGFPIIYRLNAVVTLKWFRSWLRGRLPDASFRSSCALITLRCHALQDSRLFVAVADGKGGGPNQSTVVELGEARFSGGRWHSLVISHRRSSTLLFNKDQLEVGGISFFYVLTGMVQQ